MVRAVFREESQRATLSLCFILTVGVCLVGDVHSIHGTICQRTCTVRDLELVSLYKQAVCHTLCVELLPLS